MDPLIRTVTINLDRRSYPVYIGEYLLDEVGLLCRKASLNGHAALVTDTHVGALYCEEVSKSLRNSGFKVSIHLVDAGGQFGVRVIPASVGQRSHVVEGTRSAPSPRVRGEGRGEGAVSRV